MKEKTRIDKQMKIIDRVTDKAIKQVEIERKGKSRNYFVEWFRYVELVSKDLNKLHTLSQVRNLTDKENNMVSLCGAFLYLYKMAELKDFLNLTLSDDENEQPNNFETIH